MKKLISTLAIAVALATTASAASIAWGPFDTFADNTGSLITSGSAFLYLVEGSSAKVPVNNNGEWDFAGATLVASSTFTATDGYWDVTSEGLEYGTTYVKDAYYVALVTTSTVDALTDLVEGDWYCATDIKQLVDDGLPAGASVDDSTGQIWFDATGTEGWAQITVPEPTALALLALGVAGLALKRKNV